MRLDPLKSLVTVLLLVANNLIYANVIAETPTGKPPGICKLSPDSSELFPCERVTWAGQEYLIYYSEKLKPILLVRLQDMRIIWKAGTEI